MQTKTIYYLNDIFDWAQLYESRFSMYTCKCVVARHEDETRFSSHHFIVNVLYILITHLLRYKQDATQSKFFRQS